MMPGQFDPSWGVPLMGIVIAVVAGLRGYFSDRAYTRRHGPD